MIKRSIFAAVTIISLSSFSLAQAKTDYIDHKSSSHLNRVVEILDFRRAAKINSFKTKETVEIEARLKKEAEDKANKEAEEKAKKEAEEKAKKEAEEKAKKEAEEKAKKEAEEKAKKEAEEKAKKDAEEKAKKESAESKSSEAAVDQESYPDRSTEKLYDLQTFMFNGVINWQGLKFTYYSQSVLPGGGLQIPGRHVNKDGYVSDGDGYIVLAGSAPKGTVYDTPFGYQGKIYDRGTVGNHLDVYIR